MIQALELPQLAKKNTSQDKEKLNSEEIKSIAIATVSE